MAKRGDLGEQLGLESGMQSKIADGSAERNLIALGAAVFDFPFASPYEP